MRTRVKICGITRAQDAVKAVEFGADAIGLVFYSKSPRAVSIDSARGIIQKIPPFVTVVGLFVDPSPKDVAAVLHRVSLDLLQFHGNELPSECSAYGKPYIKAIKVREGVDIAAEVNRYATARGVLLDTDDPKAPGGTGRVFDWSIIPKGLNKPIILAGGLTPENVWQAITKVRPFAVDVSSGVEADKGIKDMEKMAAFMRGVQSV
ncbi:MAG: phosphoribosylanthranilate isomerase [Gammaproteobacteria bacterium]|nr:phosphoribosylanthranilate isomerase [Gammaproteobacteria bacterium]